MNAHALARYAALCQEAGIVPIVEPEVLMDGDHTIERSFEVTSAVLDALYEALYLQRVRLDGTLLKPNMVLSGYGCPQQASVEEVAEATVRCFRATVPAAVPGIVFLSGGQSDELATAHLNAMNTLDGRAVAAQLLLRPGAAGPGAARRGRARRPTSTPARTRSSTGPSSTAPPVRGRTRPKWRRRPVDETLTDRRGQLLLLDVSARYG